MATNVKAMVSTGIKSSELSIEHLAKTFYFVLSFFCKAKSKDLADLVKISKLGLSTKPVLTIAIVGSSYYFFIFIFHIISFTIILKLNFKRFWFYLQCGRKPKFFYFIIRQ